MLTIPALFSSDKEQKILLMDINLCFSSDDMIQNCVGIAEVHIVTKSQQKFSIIGLKDPETFVNTVTRYVRSPDDVQNATKTEPMEMTLQQRADQAEEKRDVAALSQVL